MTLRLSLTANVLARGLPGPQAEAKPERAASGASEVKREDGGARKDGRAYSSGVAHPIPAPVIEILLVLGAVVGLAAVGLLGALVPTYTLLYVGGVITALGLALGVPTGFWYHVALYRTLRVRGPLPARWWLHPVPLHGQLEPEERSAVLRWFVAGGVGFGIVVVGCGVVVLGLLAATL